MAWGYWSASAVLPDRGRSPRRGGSSGGSHRSGGPTSLEEPPPSILPAQESEPLELEEPLASTSNGEGSRTSEAGSNNKHDENGGKDEDRTNGRRPGSPDDPSSPEPDGPRVLIVPKRRGLPGRG